MSDTATFGRVSWEAPVKSGAGSSDFLSLKKDGQFTIRVIGKEAFEYVVHYAPDASGATRRIRCAGRDCTLCKEGVKGQLTYALEVYSHDEKRAAIMEFGSQVYKALRSLALTKHWGDPRQYDVIIDRNKARGPSGTYTVMPIGKNELDDEAKTTIRAFLDKKIDLQKLCGPSKNEDILQKLGRMPAAGQSTGFSRTSGATNVDPVLSQAATSGDDDDDFNF